MLVGPGEVSLVDSHYDRLGPTEEAFLRAAAAAGTTRLAAHLAEILTLVAAHGQTAVVAAFARATTFSRFTAEDLRSILAAGPQAPTVTQPGTVLPIDLPEVTVRSLADYRVTTGGDTGEDTDAGPEATGRVVAR